MSRANALIASWHSMRPKRALRYPWYPNEFDTKRLPCVLKPLSSSSNPKHGWRTLNFQDLCCLLLRQTQIRIESKQLQFGRGICHAAIWQEGIDDFRNRFQKAVPTHFVGNRRAPIETSH